MKRHINAFMLLAGPLLFAVFTAIGLGQNEMAFFTVIGMAAWMIVWWISDIVPMAATALLPLVILPVSGLLNIKEACFNYANPTIYLFMGGFVIAIGLEKSGLHKRIALNILKLTGSSANSIIFGFLLATAFISMWVSNTATALMMLPIAASVAAIMKEQVIVANEKVSLANFDTCIMLSVAYAANIGGAATLVGTPPNVVLAGYVESMLGIKISFGSFMLMGVPLMLLMLGCCYFVLVMWMYPNKIGKVDSLKDVINLQLRDLGKWSNREKTVAVIFGIVSMLWVFGHPLNLLIGMKVFDDTVVALFGAVLIFVFPINLKQKEFVVEWSDAHQLPWNILLLFGGGLCLADGMQKVGLMTWMGDWVMSSIHVAPFLMMMVLAFIMLLMTELMSNVALATIFIPVVIGIAQSTKADPMSFAISVGIASSYAFMLPVGTPPNAIVYGTGKITMAQMMRAGMVLNIIAVVLICCMVYLFY